jgi:hypothetical protein
MLKSVGPLPALLHPSLSKASVIGMFRAKVDEVKFILDRSEWDDAKSACTVAETLTELTSGHARHAVAALEFTGKRVIETTASTAISVKAMLSLLARVEVELADVAPRPMTPEP